MRAGKLDRRIEIQEQSEVRSDTGNVTYTWAEFAKPWAEIEPKGGREWFDDRTIADVTLVMRTRFVPNVTPKMRIVYNSREFDILSILNIKEMNKELLYACKERL